METQETHVFRQRSSSSSAQEEAASLEPASDMNKAKICLLLILSLLAGCESVWEKQNCSDGWAEFTCKRSNDGSHKCERKKVRASPKVKSSPDHESNQKSDRLVVTCKENHQCPLFQGPSSKNQQLEFEQSGCLPAFTQIMYKATRNTVNWDFPLDKNKVGFFCKEKNATCDVISSDTNIPDKSFTVSNGSASWLDAGVYWCGLMASGRALLRKVEVKVQEFRSFSRKRTIGQNFSYYCKYETDAHTKFICKGEDPWTCRTLVSTDSPTNGSFSMKDEVSRSNITVTVTDVRAEDAGTYWCKGRSRDKTHSDEIFHRLTLTVGATTAAPPPQTHAGLSFVTVVGVCVPVMLLLLVLNFIFYYKRLSLLKNSRRGSEAQEVKEENIYEEIQELQRPTMTIYTTASWAREPCYSTVALEPSREPGPKPSSAACDYSTICYAQSPDPSALGDPADPLDPAVDHPQQEPLN